MGEKTLSTRRSLFDRYKDIFFIVLGILSYSVGYTAFILPERVVMDGAVNELHGASEAHIEVLIEQNGEDVRTSRRSVMRENQAETGTTHSTADQHVHERVLASRDNRVGCEERLQDADEEEQDAHTGNRTDDELQVQRLKGDKKKGAVEYEKRNPCLDIRRIIDKRRYT
jgi:hypothetical protein